MTVRDRIERVVVMPAAPERVWRAITEPVELARWFGNRFEFELRPGAEGRFYWENESTRIRVEAVEPPRRFAYRWYPGSAQREDEPFDSLPLTLVEFLLEPVPEGTRLTLTESGFAALPPEDYGRCYRENDEGWRDELANLATYVGTAKAA
jgi:uncharacterized protein YndB with AHSA1/START domain